MLNLSMEFTNIQYEKTFSAVMPVLLERLNFIPTDSLILRLIQKIGAKSEQSILAIMSQLSVTSKSEVLAFAFRSNKTKLLDSVRAYLESNMGKIFGLSNAYMDVSECGQIRLYLEDVKMDYYELSRLLASGNGGNPAVQPKGGVFRRALGVATRSAGALMNLGDGLGGDAMVVGLLNKGDNMRIVTSAMEDMLRSVGIYADVTDCTAMNAAHPIPAEVIERDAIIKMPQPLLEELTDVIAHYVLDLIDRANYVY